MCLEVAQLDYFTPTTCRAQRLMLFYSQDRYLIRVNKFLMLK